MCYGAIEIIVVLLLYRCIIIITINCKGVKPEAYGGIFLICIVAYQAK